MDYEKFTVAVPESLLEPSDTSTHSVERVQNMSARKLSLDPWERLQYLLAHSKIVGDCREWQGRYMRGGYGAVSDGGRDKLVHRVMWELYHGKEAPIGMDVCHKCDNPPCCEVTHLFLASRSQNLRDARIKGRLLLDGADNPNSKLSEKEVAGIRAMLMNYPYPVRPPSGIFPLIGKMYGVSRTSIRHIWEGRHWRKINGSE